MIVIKIMIRIVIEEGIGEMALVRRGGVGYISRPLTGAQRVNGLLAENRN
jgi:hypothetical protein